MLSKGVNGRTLSKAVTICGRFSTLAPTVKTHTEDEFSRAKPFSTVPGPSKLQLIRAFFPGGMFYKRNIQDFMHIAHDKYGSVYKLPGVFGKSDMLFTLNPEDFRTVHRNEGPLPDRMRLGTFIHYRKIHRKDYFNDVGGLLTTSGEEWGKMRSVVNPVLMQPKNARLYLKKLLKVNEEFLYRVRGIRNPVTLEMPANFEEEIDRLTFESVAVIALDEQLGCIRRDKDSNADAETLFKNLKRFFTLAYELDVKPSIWKIVKTPKFYEMMRTLDAITEIIDKYITKALHRIESDISGRDEEDKSVVEKLAQIDKKFAVVMATDMMMAGVDTATTTVVGILLCIAKNPDKQEKLRQELRQILPEKNSPLSMDNMKNLPYLRACIKEGMRLYSVGLGNARSNPHEIVISGYRIPKGTDIIMASNMILRDEKYFAQPNEFIPERWLRSQNNKLSTEGMNPFIYLPFGFGPRSCVGQRIVNLEMEITVASLVRNFQIAFNYPTENAFKSNFINVPAIPLQFQFEELSE